MPPAAKKDVVLILFDVKSSNKAQLLESLVKIVTHKMISTEDFCQLLLTNSSETVNAKNVSNVSQTGIDELNPQQIFKCINEAKSSDNDPTNLLDVLLLAIYYMKQSSKIPGVVNRQIIYFTDLESQLAPRDSVIVSKVIKELNDNEIYLYIVGPDVKLPFIITKPEDVPKSMKKIMVDESNGAHVVAKEIVQGTERSVLCDLKVGTNIVHFFKNSRGSQPWLVPMSIGNNLSIPAKTLKIFNDDSNLKLVSTNTDRYSSKTYLLEDDESVELPFEDLINGVVYHGNFVRIEDEDMFKFETERSFDLVGFTKSKFLSEVYIEGDATFHVLPHEESEDGNYDLFRTLVNVLAKDDKYAIFQRIYNKNNNPRYFVLRPEPDLQPPRFVMTSLPYADDIVGNYLKSTTPKKSDVKEEEEDEFKRFCSSMDVHSDICSLEIPLAPSMMMDLFTDNIVKETARKLCDKDFEFGETEPFDLDSFPNNEYWEVLKNCWPEVEESAN